MRRRPHPAFNHARRRRAQESSPVYLVDSQAADVRGILLDPGGPAMVSGDVFAPEAVSAKAPHAEDQGEAGRNSFAAVKAAAVTITLSGVNTVSLSESLATVSIGSSSISSRATAPTATTTSTPTRSTGSATGTAPTSSFDSGQPSSDQPGELKHAGLYAGVAFGVIAGITVFIALLVYWLRVRTRTHRRSVNRMATWPWDHDRLGVRRDTHTFHGGGGGNRGLRKWDASRMVETSSDAGKARFTIEDDDDGPPRLLVHDGRLRDSYAFPLPPRAPPMPTRMRMRADSPYRGSPFVTIPLHADTDRELSVRDMAQEMGALKITNLMPGDISESSRASTALGIRTRDSSPSSSIDFATPTQSHPMTSEDGTPRHPWAPLRTWKSRSSRGGWQDGYMLEDGDDVPVPFPGSSPVVAPDAEMKQEGWAASIRSNLFSALNAVVGANASQANLAESHSPSRSDNLTRAPERRNSQRSRGLSGPREKPGRMSRSSTQSTTASASGWTLEETGQGRGVVHIRGHPEQGSLLTEDPFSDNPQVPTTETHKPTPNMGPRGRASSADSDDGQPTTRSNGTPATAVVSSHPPRLPSIPSMSPSPSEGGSEAGPARQGTRSTARFQHRKRTKRRRPTAIMRKSSSQCSAVSVGSEMSRMSSVTSEGLTDGERFAKRVLQERRRRVMEMTVGRRKTGRARATTISRRRPKERFKQRLANEAS